MRTTCGPGILSAAAALSLVWACSSSSSPGNSLGGGDGGGQPDTSVDDGGGDDGEGDASADVTVDSNAEDTGSGSDSGPAGDAAVDAAGSDAGNVKGGDAAGPMSECPTGHAWTAGPVQVSDAIARFSGIAPTGLNAAWTRASGDVIAADRATASSPFVTLMPLLPGLPTSTRPAIDSTGTLVFGLDSTSLYTQMWQRTDLQSSWALFTGATTPFDAIISAVNQESGTWSEPAFGASGDRLFYLMTPPSTGGVPSMYESQWDAQSSQWAVGVKLNVAQLASVDATHRRRPTGASADDLTLFYFDEVAAVEGAAWRLSTSQPFSYFETIPAAPEAAPNLDCTTLYVVSGGNGTGGGTGIAIAQ